MTEPLDTSMEGLPEGRLVGRVAFADVIRRAFAKAAEKSPGGDIFIHGGPNSSVSKRDWTWGCISITDREMERVYSMVKPGTPIFILP